MEDPRCNSKRTSVRKFLTASLAVFAALSIALACYLTAVPKVYALKVDGEMIGSHLSREAIEGVLDSIIAIYSTDGTCDASFSRSVEIVEGRFPKDTRTTEEELLSILHPDSADSPYSLAVITVDRTYIDYELAIQTVFTTDDTLYTDETAVLNQGHAGSARDEYELKKYNGLVVRRTYVGSSVVYEPEDRVVAVGSIVCSTGEYIWPTKGMVSSSFGRRSVRVGSSNHEGLDIACVLRTEIWASDGGTVIYADWAEGYGNFVKIEHENGDITCYAHMDEFVVAVGDRVSQGDVIGYMGSTGVSSGPHLHFELRKDGDRVVDPVGYFIDELDHSMYY